MACPTSRGGTADRRLLLVVLVWLVRHQGRGRGALTRGAPLRGHKRLAVLPSPSTRSGAWAEHPFPAGRSGQGVFVHCVQEHEISHRGEIYLMLGLMGMEAPDV
jgi:hypothetical protein